MATVIVGQRLEGVPLALALSLAAVPALAVLVSVGASQWLVLRHHVDGAGWWVAANASAWLLGMPVVFAAMGLVDEDTPFAAVAALASASGLLMGAVVAAVTGGVLVWLLRAPSGHQLAADAGQAAPGGTLRPT